MALTPTIQSSQGQAQATVESGADVAVSQSGIVAAINLPAEEILASQASGFAAVRKTPDMQVAQISVLALVRGRVANPNVRAWTFSLDGHDFYVLRLGDDLTLVYDLYSEQWVEWQSGDLPFWRPNTGINWLDGQKLAPDYGSNVVVGDDTFGLLWFLDPEQPYDENPDPAAPQQEIYFERITMGQLTMRGREVMPCYTAWITADMGAPAYTGAGVTLFTSDDSGQTFYDHGLVTVAAGDFSPQLAWYSLGQIGAPGRLFKIVDDGAIARIDCLEMNDPDDAG